MPELNFMTEKSMYCFQLPLFCISRFSTCSCSEEKEIEENGKRISFSSYSLDELAEKAKNDPMAKSEIILRTEFDILRYAKTLYQNRPYLDYDRICQARQKTVLQAIGKYDRTKGPFMRLLRKRLYWSGKSRTKAAAIHFHQERRHLGSRIYDIRQSAYRADSGVKDSRANQIRARKVDIDAYREKLNFPRQERMNRYFLGLSFKDIAEIQGRPVSTISYQIYTILEDRKKIRKIH